MQIHRLELQDSRWQFGDISKIEQDIFSLKKNEILPNEWDSPDHFMVSIEMDSDLLKTERTVYGFLDWIGNIGGLYDGLRLILSIIVSFWNYKFY